MPSFDVVSEVDKQELDNAINQARREVENRYDFKGSETEIELDDLSISINTSDDYKVQAVQEILISKAIKRDIDAKAFDFGKVEDASGSRKRCSVKIIQGIEKELAKKMVKIVKDTKIKVQAQIMDDKVRVTGKKRDDLQNIMQALKSSEIEIPLQFDNFRD